MSRLDCRRMLTWFTEGNSCCFCSYSSYGCQFLEAVPFNNEASLPMRNASSPFSQAEAFLPFSVPEEQAYSFESASLPISCLWKWVCECLNGSCSEIGTEESGRCKLLCSGSKSLLNACLAMPSVLGRVSFRSSGSTWSMMPINRWHSEIWIDLLWLRSHPQ